MKQHDYLLPGIAAILVALLSSIYWVLVFGEAATLNSEFFYKTTIFGFTDLIFLVVGILSIFVYMGLGKILKDHYNYQKLDLILKIIIAICVIFYGGTFFLSLFGSTLNQVINESIVFWLWVSSIILFGIIDIILAITLLIDRKMFSNLLVIFAVVNLIMGILELTVIFSFTAIFLFPIVTLLLAIIFLRKPETVEFV